MKFIQFYNHRGYSYAFNVLLLALAILANENAGSTFKATVTVYMVWGLFALSVGLHSLYYIWLRKAIFKYRERGVSRRDAAMELAALTCRYTYTLMHLHNYLTSNIGYSPSTVAYRFRNVVFPRFEWKGASRPRITR